MATVTNDEGRRRVLVKVGAKRYSVSLGPVDAEAAEEIAERLQHLADMRRLATPHLVRQDVLQWLAQLAHMDAATYDRIAAAGLAAHRVPVAPRPVVTLEALCARVRDEYAGNKATTRDLYKRFFAKPLAYFGPGREVASITHADADAFVAELRSKPLQKTGLPLSPATVARSVKAYRLLFKKAVRWGYVKSNPFEGIKAGGMSNHARKQFVPLADFAKVMAAERSAEFRAVLALCRYGALRCPSEVLALRWGDVRTDEGKLIVRSPKTEHHAGGEARIVPLFPELAEALHAWYVEAPEGSEYVITMHRDRGPKVNYRKRLGDLIEKAGVKPWGKLFHNLRASRESELVERYPLATVARWLGHAPEVAAAHYLTQTDGDANFADAVAVRQPVRAGGKRSENKGKQKGSDPAKTLDNQGYCGAATERHAHPVGLEFPQKSPPIEAGDDGCAPACAPDLPPDLARIVEAWQALPPNVRAQIERLAGVAKPDTTPNAGQ